jgi:hypothetical protein
MCCCTGLPAWERPRCLHHCKRNGVSIRQDSGPAIEKPRDLAALLTNLNDNDILFIDEIHRLNRAVGGDTVSRHG